MGPTYLKLLSFNGQGIAASIAVSTRSNESNSDLESNLER